MYLIYIINQTNELFNKSKKLIFTYNFKILHINFKILHLISKKNSIFKIFVYILYIWSNSTNKYQNCLFFMDI